MRLNRRYTYCMVPSNASDNIKSLFIISTFIEKEKFKQLISKFNNYCSLNKVEYSSEDFVNFLNNNDETDSSLLYIDDFIRF